MRLVSEKRLDMWSLLEKEFTLGEGISGGAEELLLYKLVACEEFLEVPESLGEYFSGQHYNSV
jgi:hypothetical protein